MRDESHADDHDDAEDEYPPEEPLMGCLFILTLVLLVMFLRFFYS